MAHVHTSFKIRWPELFVDTDTSCLLCTAKKAGAQIKAVKEQVLVLTWLQSPLPAHYIPVVKIGLCNVIDLNGTQ